MRDKDLSNTYSVSADPITRSKCLNLLTKLSFCSHTKKEEKVVIMWCSPFSRGIKAPSQLCTIRSDTRKIQKHKWVTIACCQKAYDLSEVQKVIRKDCIWVCGFGLRQLKLTLYIYRDIGPTRVLPYLFSAFSCSKNHSFFLYDMDLNAAALCA